MPIKIGHDCKWKEKHIRAPYGESSVMSSLQDRSGYAHNPFLEPLVSIAKVASDNVRFPYAINHSARIEYIELIHITTPNNIFRTATW